MTAVPIPFDPAPALARFWFVIAALWARSRLTVRQTVTTRARGAMSALFELAGAAAVIRGLWELAPWLGWTGIGLVLALVGWMLEPREVTPS